MIAPCRRVFFWITAAAVVLLSACDNGSNKGEQQPPVSISVDSTAQTNTETKTVSGVDGGEARPLATVTDGNGRQAEFVLNEILVSTDDTVALDELMSRWNGTIMKSIDFSAAGLTAVPALHLVQVDVSEADSSHLIADLRSINANIQGDHTVSSEDGLKLWAAAASEGATHGMQVALNWVLEPQAIADGNTLENSTGASGYVADAFAWPYMNSGSPQDIGVGKAWQALASARKLDNSVPIMVMDGGFRMDADLPDISNIYGGGSWSTRNSAACAGNPCPWHGTVVVASAMAKPDNYFGVAGPAGPVAELIAVQSPPEDFFGVLRYLAETIAALAIHRPKIINISAASDIPAGGALFVKGILDLVTGAIRTAGTLIIASAGNSAVDVDSQDCFLDVTCWEGSLTIPCELAGVICVGGMDWNSTARAEYTAGDGSVSGSNYGSNTSNDSVDIYGPYVVWGPSPSTTSTTPAIVTGTSFASPFVAGIAGLIWAADPTMSANAVWNTMRDSAHTGDVDDNGGHQRRVNAFGAVQAALGGDVPPYLTIDFPTEGTSRNWNTPMSFTATSFDADGPAPTVTWSSNVDGTLGTGTSGLILSTLSEGSHVITATAVSGTGITTALVNITMVNQTPSVVVLTPTVTSFCSGEPITLSASVTDANNPTGFPDANISWSSTPAGISGTGAEVLVTPADGSYTVTVTATDEFGQTASDSTSFSVASCASNPPTVTITSPTVDYDGYASASDANGWYHEVTLTGSATDVEDGTLSGASLVWTTDRGDVQPGSNATLGTGNSITVRLYSECALVNHTVTLTATDSDATSRTAVRQFVVRLLC